jgi:hypothetical protein
MGNNTSAAELTRQGAILGEKLRLPTTGGGTAKADHTGSELPPKVCFQGLSLSKMQRIQKQIEFEYPFLSNVYESILVTNNRLPDCPIGGCQPPPCLVRFVAQHHNARDQYSFRFETQQCGQTTNSNA